MRAPFPACTRCVFNAAFVIQPLTCMIQQPLGDQLALDITQFDLADNTRLHLRSNTFLKFIYFYSSIFSL